MAWKFRKRIKIAPGVTLNLSKSGVSTTVGTKGASVNMGKNGIYLNTGIPGTGIYDRQRLDGKTKKKSNQQQNYVEQGYAEYAEEEPPKTWAELSVTEKIVACLWAVMLPFLWIVNGILWLVANMFKILGIFLLLAFMYGLLTS